MKTNRIVGKALIILLLLLTIFLLAQFKAFIELIKTGKIIEVFAASQVTVRENLDVFNVSVNVLRKKVNPGEVVYANISIKSEIYEGEVTVKWIVEDNLGNVLNSNFTTLYLSYGYVWNSIKGLLIPSNTSEGTYLFKVEITAPGYYSTGKDIFEVALPSVALPQPGIPSPPFPRELRKEVEVYYPEKIIALLNTTKIFYISIKNLGETNISEIFLFLEGLELSWFSIYPHNITLKPNETQNFTVRLTIPPNALIKDYPISITLVSREILMSFQITVNVRRVFNYSELQEKLEDLKRDVEILENRSKVLEENKVDVREIKMILSLVKGKLTEIEEEIAKENPERASELVYETEKLVEILRFIIENKKQITILWGLPQIYVFLLLILVLILSLILFKRIKKSRPSHTIEEIIKKVKPNSYITLYAELKPHAYGIPNIYALEDNTGIIYATSPRLIEAGIYTIEGIVKEENGRKYLEIKKLKKR
ncbi:MAG: hypothetical protein QXQ69_02600 [Candidatus Aenigmatarchaeota archaeon]